MPQYFIGVLCKVGGMVIKMSNYVEFNAFGAYCGEFIDWLVSSDYEAFEVSSTNDIFTVKTSPRNYPAIAKKAREFRTKTKIVKRNGWYFTLRRYRKRVGIPLGILAFFGILVIMSNFIWSIKISGNVQVTDWQIMEQLDKRGIRPGVSKSGFNANLAEIELLLSLPKLSWVSIERAGSRLNVKVSEITEESGNTADAEKIPLSVPCDIIAGYSGQLVRAEVYRGELLCEVGDGIVQGDVVVSGSVTDFNGGYNYIHADAKLFLEVEEFEDFYQPYNSLDTAENGRSVTSRSIVFLGKQFGGGKDIGISKNDEHIDYSETVTLPRILGFPMPFRIFTQKYAFRDRVEASYSPAEARQKLDRLIELYENNFLKDAEISEKVVEYYPDDNGIGALVRYVFCVDASVKREIIPIIN